MIIASRRPFSAGCQKYSVTLPNVVVAPVARLRTIRVVPIGEAGVAGPGPPARPAGAGAAAPAGAAPAGGAGAYRFIATNWPVRSNAADSMPSTIVSAFVERLSNPCLRCTG